MNHVEAWHKDGAKYQWHGVVCTMQCKCSMNINDTQYALQVWFNSRYGYTYTFRYLTLSISTVG